MVGISTDDHSTQCSFASSVRAPFPMIGDPAGEIARRYDVVWPLLRLVKRVTFVLDEQGRVEAVFHHELRIKSHVENVLSWLKKRQARGAGRAS